MADGIRFDVHGIEELDEALAAFLRELADELRQGFVPEEQYRGMGGEPFTLERIDVVARQVGLT